MHIDNLSKGIKINRSPVNITPASGNKLKILGQSAEFEAVDCTMKMKIAPTSHLTGHFTLLQVIRIYCEIQIAYLKFLNNINIPHGFINVTSHRETLERFDYLLKVEIDNQSVCTFGKHFINTGGNSPVAVKNHKAPVHWEQEIDEQISQLLKNGIIQPSNITWFSRVDPIAKKDSQLRLCIDYSPLDRTTIKDK